MIRVCAEFGLQAVRVEGAQGPGSRRRPPAACRAEGRAIGARSRAGSHHGLRADCDCDLSWFDRIVPCGIRDAGVTFRSRPRPHPVSVSDVTPLLERHLAAALGYRTWRRIPRDAAARVGRVAPWA